MVYSFFRCSIWIKKIIYFFRFVTLNSKQAHICLVTVANGAPQEAPVADGPVADGQSPMASRQWPIADGLLSWSRNVWSSCAHFDPVPVAVGPVADGQSLIVNGLVVDDPSPIPLVLLIGSFYAILGLLITASMVLVFPAAVILKLLKLDQLLL